MCYCRSCYNVQLFVICCRAQIPYHFKPKPDGGSNKNERSQKYLDEKKKKN